MVEDASGSRLIIDEDAELAASCLIAAFRLLSGHR